MPRTVGVPAAVDARRCGRRRAFNDNLPVFRPLPPLVLLAAALLFATGAAAAPGDVAAAGVQLRTERSLGSGRAPATPLASDGPTFGRALRIEGRVEEQIEMSGAAELRSGGSVLRAERIVYRQVDDQLTASGDVRLFRDGALFTGPSLVFQPDAQSGSMPEASFSYAPRRARGSAALLEFIDPDRSRLTGATYTTCAPGDRSWWVQAEQLDIDRVDELAVARGGRLYFQEVPIFASPYFQFPLGDRRRSGVLTPSFGLNSRLGVEATVPLYWNIAPNRDATLAPRVMSRRGVLLQNEVRYLEPTFHGNVQYNLLPDDSATGDKRTLTSLQHSWAGRSGFGAGLNYNRVSDDRYFVDFGSNIVTASQSVLPQEGFLSYARPHLATALRVTRNQTLQDPLQPQPLASIKPYERIPQLTLNLLHADWHGFDLSLATEAARFEHPTLENGTRYVVNPSVAYPWIAPGWFVIPRMQWHSTRYQLDPALRPTADRASRTLPVASLDAGLVFERDAQWLGRGVVQTLEPRLFYAYVPFRNQSDLPSFDSALADFNFSQLFAENVFVGGDRIGEANQLTAALVGRVLDRESGNERLRAAVGQRYYFAPQRVTLPGGSERTDQSSDLLFGLTGFIARHWITDVAVQHSTAEDQVVRATLGLRWQPRPASVLSLAYRYKLNNPQQEGLEQVDFAAQWPLTARWYGVTRLNWSALDRRWVEVLGGLEYKADCWVMRMAVHRFSTAEQTDTTQFFLAIELNGLGSVGTSPIEQLRRNIPGYQVINPPPAEPGRFEFYE